MTFWNRVRVLKIQFLAMTPLESWKIVSANIRLLLYYPKVVEGAPVPSLDVLRIYVAAEGGDVTVLDRMCARVKDADRDRFRLLEDADEG